MNIGELDSRGRKATGIQMASYPAGSQLSGQVLITQGGQGTDS